MRLDRVTVVVKRWGVRSAAPDFCWVGVAEAADEIDGLAEEVFRRLGRSGLHQLEFERELFGFGTAFRSEVVLAVEHI